MELAKPVIGTKEPPPANFPILLNKFKEVKNAVTPIKIIETIVPEVSISHPLYLQISDINCPIEQMRPPNPESIKTIL